MKKFTTDQKIVIFSNLMIKNFSSYEIIIQSLPHPDYVLSSLLFTYFENIAKFKDGYVKDGKSKAYFKEGVKWVFPEIKNWGNDLIDNTLETWYKLGRCSIYHTGFLGGYIYFNSQSNLAFTVDKSNRDKPKIIIHPSMFIEKIILHFEVYIQMLLIPDNAEERRNFEKRFNYIFKGHFEEIGMEVT